MSDDPRVTEIKDRLRRPDSVEDVRRTLTVLDELKALPESVKVAEEGFRQAFACLRDLTAAEPDRAAEILFHDLPPRCLVPDVVGEKWYGSPPSHTFGEWLDELPEEHRQRVRATAL